jgi:GR25 family glycosyltransferase involved in LPS biosynthesis
MIEDLAPIVLFVYNRPIHTKLTLDSLSKNPLAEKSEIYIFSDGIKEEHSKEDLIKIEETRSIIHSINWCKKLNIETSNSNKGLANSIIDGVTKIISEKKKVIVLEDDLTFSPNFLTFMNQALIKYKDNTQIYSISGYRFPGEIDNIIKEDVFLFPRVSSWGWGTWLDRWENIDWQIKNYDQFIVTSKEKKKFNRGGDDLSNMLKLQMEKKINSWAIRWAYNQYREEKLTLYPKINLVSNIGIDGSGTHCKPSSKNYGIINESDFIYIYLADNPRESKKVNKILTKFFKPKLNLFKKIIYFFKKIIKLKNKI